MSVGVAIIIGIIIGLGMGGVIIGYLMIKEES